MIRIPCLSVRQPWASLIVAGVKDVENRSWCPDYRGPLWIHASGSRPKRAAIESVAERLPRGVSLPPTFVLSAVLGLVDLTDIVGDSQSPWAVDGEYHWVLARPRPLQRPIPGHGKLRLWYLPRDVEREARQQLGLPSEVARHADGSATAWWW